MSTHIEEPIAEGSDYPFRCLLVDEDGEAVDVDAISEILMTIRDLESGTVIETDVDVTDGLLPDPLDDPDVNFQINIAAEWNVSLGTPPPEMQLRLLTFKITHSGGRKRNQEVTYNLDAMQDVPTEP